LIQEYGERPANASQILPGMITYTGTEGGHRWWAYNNSELAKEIASALDEHRWRQKQYKAAEQWLVEEGFDLDAESISIAKLAKALKREFPDAYMRFAHAGGLLPFDGPLDEQKAIIPASDASPAKQTSRATDQALVEADEFERAYEASFGKAIDMPEVAEPAAKAAPLNHDLATMPSASDASPAKQTSRATDQALVEAEIMKEFPGGVPLDMPTRRVKALLNGREKLKDISSKTFDRAVQKLRNTA